MAHILMRRMDITDASVNRLSTYGYSKTYIDSSFSQVYTKTHIDGSFNNYYNRAYIDTSFNSIYNKGQIDSFLQNYYNKIAIDNSFNSVVTRLYVDSSLNNYVLKSYLDTSFSSVYTKTEANSRFTLTNLLLDSQYDENIDLSINTIRVNVDASFTAIKNYINTNFYDKTTVDSSFANYYNRTYIDTSLNNYALKSYVDTSLNNYSTKVYLDTSLNNYALKSNIDSSLANYYSKTYIDSSFSYLSNIINSIDLSGSGYSKTYIDNSFNSVYTKGEADARFTLSNLLLDSQYDENIDLSINTIRVNVDASFTAIKTYINTNFYDRPHIDNSFNNVYTKLQVDASLSSIVSGSTTITNNINNRILTATGATSINGEQNFTFDGSACILTGTLSVSGKTNIGEELTISSLNSSLTSYIDVSYVTLNASSNHTIYLGETVDISAVRIYLGNATNYVIGRRFHIYNDTSRTLAVYNSSQSDSSSTNITSIYSKTSSVITLANNTIATGKWLFDLVGSGNFAGSYAIMASNGSNVNTNGYYEFVPGVSSAASDAPFYIITKSILVGISASASTNTNPRTISIYKNIGGVEQSSALGSVTIAGNSVSNTNTSVAAIINAGDTLSVKCTNGSTTKAGIVLYLTPIQ